MAATKILSLLLVFCPILSFGQQSIYPKDTIYVKYQEERNASWNAKFERKYKQKLGIYFNIETEEGDMPLFYPHSEEADTLCIEMLKDYHFSDLHDIRKKEIEWVDKKYKNQKYKPYTGSKNAVFQTYVIEAISDKKFVKYPVIWRNERI
ncbi:hypothetical protein SAMN05444483_1276 [Salegentibacter echinorum]|uniref:GLPGLI family protein n=1 Tax=Salegentibacter echinorum TaxID=1073325 RepID=A0A1M5MCJ2_SALEC|nr:hypothetical protein [Salegentibacter echinorum]SHG75030.1 hypothetical protein SAMN05444483_1276 [Salegentibacter echinorum]